MLPLHSQDGPESSPAPSYEPPAVEMVLTADELEREVHYAGANSNPVSPVPQ